MSQGHAQRKQSLKSPAKMNKAKDTKVNVATSKKKRNDILFIVGLFVIISVVFLASLLLRSEGDTAVVTVDGKLWGEYPLRDNISVMVTNGGGSNLLIIENGKAYIENASCPDGICSAHRPISHSGESIICLPNKVVVEIRSQNEDAPDIIS